MLMMVIYINGCLVKLAQLIRTHMLLSIYGKSRLGYQKFPSLTIVVALPSPLLSPSVPLAVTLLITQSLAGGDGEVTARACAIMRVVLSLLSSSPSSPRLALALSKWQWQWQWQQKQQGLCRVIHREEATVVDVANSRNARP
jgi:hypothetical protein